MSRGILWRIAKHTSSYIIVVMIHPCQSELLFNTKCNYDGFIDENKHAWGLRHINGKDYYYHYLDYVKSENEFIQISSSTKKKLCQHLLELYLHGHKEHWIENILSACNYRVPEEK